VDRNGDGANSTALPRGSLSARRAWIEMPAYPKRARWH